MIKTTNAIQIFQINLGRTNALIVAMDKIKAYNRIYQMSESATSLGLEHAKTVEQIQNQELNWIELSCAEHAIISLATAFETYYKELIQELLGSYPDYFLSQDTKNVDQVRELVTSKEKYTWEEIGSRLKLKYRLSYYNFFKDYSVPFLSEKEAELIDYIFVKRNGFVHSASISDKKTVVGLQKIHPPVKEEVVRTEAKRLRNKLERTVISLHKRVLEAIDV
jgi:ribosomal protein S17E